MLRFDTRNPPGNEVECIQYIMGVLRGAGIPSQILARDPARPNLLARLAGRGAAPPLLLYGHIDVVGTSGQDWIHPPFAAEVADGYVHGRGALDMKGGIAMLLTAFLRAHARGTPPAGDVLLAIVGDEETDGRHGAGYLVAEHAEWFRDVRHAISEFGGFTLHFGRLRVYPIQVAEKQACWIRATVRGPAGHGALPVKGGAMARLGRLLADLERRPLPIHVTTVLRQGIEAIAAALPFPKSFLVRQLARPRVAQWALGLFN